MSNLKALTRQKHNRAMTMPKGKAEIKVMVCKAFKPPVRSSNTVSYTHLTLPTILLV